MKQYLDLLREIYEHGTVKTDRTGVGTKSIFGHQMRFDLSEGFPLLTTKKVFTRGIIEELLWFLAGDTNKKHLQEKGVHIWDGWGDDESGELGPVYGHQWRAWDDYKGGHIDQIAQAVDLIRNHPDSRRILVNAWNVAQIDDMALPPCHCLFQFYVADGKLSCQLYDGPGMRSGTGQFHPHDRRHPSLSEPFRAGPAAAQPRAANPAEDAHKPRCQGHILFQG